MTANKQTMQPGRNLLPIMAGLFVLSWGLVFRQPLFALPLIAVSSALLAWFLVQNDLEPAFMKIVAFLLPFSTTLPLLQESMLRIPTEPMIGLAILMLPLYLLKAQRRGSNPAWKEAVIVLPLFGAYLLSTLFSEMPVVSIKFTFVNIAYILVFYILLLHLYRQHPNLFADMIKLYGIGFLLVFLWSLYQYHTYGWNPVVVRGIFRPFYNDHTIFGAAAAMLAVLAAGTGMRRKSLPGLITGRGAMFLFMIAVLYSTSRGAMLSLLFAGLVAVLLALRPRPLVLGGGLVLLLLTVLVFYPGIRDRIQDTSVASYYHDADHRDPGSPGVDDSIDVSSVERVNRWISAWRMFRERPLTGFGFFADHWPVVVAGEQVLADDRGAYGDPAAGGAAKVDDQAKAEDRAMAGDRAMVGDKARAGDPPMAKSSEKKRYGDCPGGIKHLFFSCPGE